MKARSVNWIVKLFPALHRIILAAGALALAGCGSGVPPIPPAPASTATAVPPDARALLDACVAAHGGATAYARLHDVNVRFDSHWAAIGPKLQPVLSDTGYREGSEERYLATAHGWIVGQEHRGPKGRKHVLRMPPDQVTVTYIDDPAPSADHDVNAAASLVTDAYSLFLFGPDFFVRHAASLQRLPTTGDVDGHVCDELLAGLRPGFGLSKDDRVVLYIDRQDHLLRRVEFTLNALDSTQGAEVHVDFSAHRKLAGVMWPTQFYEHIDRPVNLDAHRWHLLGFDVNRGYRASDLTKSFTGKAAAPAKPLPDAGTL